MDKYVQKVLEFQDIIIYGEGIVGKRTFEILCSLEIGSRIRCFAKSQKEFNPYRISNIEVKSIYGLQKYYKKALFLLAVGDKYISEVTKVVKKLKIRNYLDARKLYDDDLKKTELEIEWRKLKNKIYERKEKTNFRINCNRVYATHITYCLSGNAGDTMLSWCVRRFLNFSKWEIRNVQQKMDESSLNEINKTDALIIGGGGLFLPDTNLNSISGWQWAVSNEQIEKINVPIIIYSVGYNYFRGQALTDCFISSINYIVKKAAFVGLRNRGSVEAIRNLVDNELRDKIEYQPCITTLIRKIYNVSPQKGSKSVAINIAFDREELRYGDSKERILREIAKAVAEIEQMGRSIVYVAHCKNDTKFLPYLDEIGVLYKIKKLNQCLPYEVIHFYRKMEAVIGMRGHAQMIPFGIGVKIISLGTHDKMRWFLSDVNLEDCYIDLNADIDTICNRIIDIFQNIAIKNPVEMDKRMKREQDKLWELSGKNKKKIIQIVSESR